MSDKGYREQDRKELSKQDINHYLFALGKELKSEYGKNARFELVVVGGAAIACQYQFRQMTEDIDAFPSSSVKSAAEKIADANELPDDWINNDFMETESFTPKIRQYAKYYKTFSNILDVRILSDEYLIAMKTKSLREYKRDYSDIIGIIKEMKEKGKEPSMEGIESAYHNLYGEKDNIPDNARAFLIRVLQEKDLDDLYNLFSRYETDRGKLLKEA